MAGLDEIGHGRETKQTGVVQTGVVVPMLSDKMVKSTDEGEGWVNGNETLVEESNEIMKMGEDQWKVCLD